jgi:hypothetical protein
MESNSSSFFNDPVDDADESISLNESELNNILTEAVDSDAGTALKDEPDVIVIDREDLNDGALPPAETVEEIMPPAPEEFEVTEESPVLESPMEGFPVEEASVPDLSEIPEPAFAGMDQGFLSEGIADQPVAVEEQLFDESVVPESDGMGFESIQPDEPSAVEEISGLPDIGNGIQETTFEPLTDELPPVEQTVWDEAIAPGETSEVTPLDLGLDQAPAADVSFADVEEIDLEAEPAAVNESAATEQPVLEDPAAPGSFFRDDEEDEAITLSSDELNNILDDAVVEPVSIPPSEAVEETIMIPEAAPIAVEPVLQAEGILARDNLKEIFVYLDNLLDKLPDEEVRRFAESRYYDLYNALFEELGLV